jgi:transposase
MMDVMIGVDPHKGSHTATMLDRDERELRRITVRCSRRQMVELLEWVDGVQPRTWAVESAWRDGLSALPAARRRRRDGAERASDVGVAGAGAQHRAVDKNDPNDARSVAAALRAPTLAQVRRADHVTVCRLLAKRHSDLARWRTKLCCRLHALVAELVHLGGVRFPVSGPVRTR